jgi:hypothetical protein
MIDAKIEYKMLWDIKKDTYFSRFDATYHIIAI